MTRSRLLLLIVAAVAALFAVWWLLRAPAPPLPVPAPPPPPVPAPPVPVPLEAVELLRRELAPLRRGGATRVRWRAASPGELESYRRWIAAELRRATRSAAPDELPEPAGFQSRPLGDWGRLLSEDPARRRGAGALVLRKGPARPLLIEVPHSFFDEGTLDIGLEAFVSSGARALLVNTVHRRRALAVHSPDAGPSDDGGYPASDVAHAEASFFLSAHAACVDAFPALEVVQLHGFANAAAPATEAIVSAAGSRADPVPVARALERALGIRAAVYPTQIRLLGGTKNRQAHYSIAAGQPFLHVELSRTLRDQLEADSDRLRRFSEALLGSPR